MYFAGPGILKPLVI